MDIIKILKNSELFSELNTDEISELNKICQIKEYDEQEEIFKEGDTSNELYILGEGRVLIEIQLKAESERASVHTVDEGQIFGEVALVDGNPRSAAAKSVKRSKLIVISKDDIDALMKKNPRMGYIIMRNFSQILCSRVRKSTSNLKASLMWG
ncbi:MAG: cyclic nucleotide-binding domain-containing protein [Spirochaetes bacterium]|nr:cyclic nucleotide-binding domain-containing protein [Spirochaetota bacterium]